MTYSISISLSPNDIYNVVNKIAFDGHFLKEDFSDILKSLSEKEIIYKLPSGSVTLNKKGEKLVENYEFYAAFMSPDEWKVVNDGREVGLISSMCLLGLKPGSHILLAGKRWEILEIKEKTKAVIVKRALVKKKISFNGGEQNIHRKIHQKMREIYANKTVPKYLSVQAIQMLEEAFQNYETHIAPKDSSILEVLEGSKIQSAVRLLLIAQGISCEYAAIGFISSCDRKSLIETLKSIDFTNLIPEKLVNDFIFGKNLKKFDWLLPENILNKSFIKTKLDFKGAKEFINGLAF